MLVLVLPGKRVRPAEQRRHREANDHALEPELELEVEVELQGEACIC